MRLEDLDDISTIKKFNIIGTHPCRVQKVYDGDTCTLVIELFDTFFSFNFRLFGLDTPERTGKYKKYGLEARNKLIQLLTDKEIILDYDYSKSELEKIFEANTKILTVVVDDNTDKYNRQLGTIFYGNFNINEEMIASGYANKYDGGKKTKWISRMFSRFKKK